MKRLAVRLFVCLALTANAGTVIDSLGDFKSQVRERTGLESTSFLPDTTLSDIANGNIVWTSVDIGGVESQVRFVTVAGQAFYATNDSVVEILHATFRTQEGATRSVKAWYPQFFEDLQIGDPNTLTPSEDDIPFAYQHWDDSVQLMPAPARADDTVILKVFVEHRAMSADTMVLQFQSDAYAQAALMRACGEALETVKRYEEAEWYFKKYEAMKVSLREAQTRRFDVMKSQ